MNEPASQLPRPEELAAHLAGAETPALLMTTAHLTRAAGILQPEWRPVPSGLPRGGLQPEQEAAVREFCLTRLAAHAASRCPAPPRPDRALLRSIAEWAIGPVSDQEVEVLDDALVMDGEDPGAPDWTLADAGDGREMRVAVVGAGVSGLLTGLRLRQASHSCGR
jgi:4-hydroxyacetophenone monooxygenase